jgi:hypothetical protein
MSGEEGTEGGAEALFPEPGAYMKASGSSAWGSVMVALFLPFLSLLVLFMMIMTPPLGA